MIPLLLGVTVLSFGIMKLAPGDFLTTMALNPQIAPETIELMRRQFGLDQPWYIQYWKWLIGILQFDFGYSFTYRVPVSTLILERVGNTLILSIGAAFISWSVALPLGVYSALYQNTRFDRIASFFSFTTISVPSFFPLPSRYIHSSKEQAGFLPAARLAQIIIHWICLERYLTGFTI